MFNGSYGLTPSGTANQTGLPKVQGRMAPDENYPAYYGHALPQTAPMPPYFSTDMARQVERRPLQSVQFDGGSFMGKVTHRQQHFVQQPFIGLPEPSMCGSLQPGERPFGLSASEPIGYPMNPVEYVRYYPESQRAGYATAAQPSNIIYSEAPPVSYSGFTPSQTSSPSELAAPGHAQQRQRAAQPHQQQQPPAPQWGSPVPAGLAAFEEQQLVVAVGSRPQERKPSNTGVAADHGVKQASKTTSASPSVGSPAVAATPTAATETKTQPQSRFESAPSETSKAAPPVLEMGLRVLTGTVDNILSWGRKLEEEARPNIIFEIVGSLDSVARGPWHSSRLLSLRSLDSSATISAVYWEIDRPLAPPPTGSIVACMSRLGVRGPQRPQLVQRRIPRLQVLRLRTLSAGQVPHLKRLAYVSGHGVQQGALEAPPPPAADRLGSQTPTSTPAPSSLKQTLISSYATAGRPERP